MIGDPIGAPVARFVQPDVVATHFHLTDGDVVADFGAGTGFYMKALSRAVGNRGRVYALEIQRGLVDKLGMLARECGYGNVEPIWCDLETMGGTKLADGILDAGILINTLFQIQDKDTALREIYRTIKSGGQLFVIDWTESFSGMGPQPGDVIDEYSARSLVESVGFKYERSFEAGGHHYGMSFRRL